MLPVLVLYGVFGICGYIVYGEVRFLSFMKYVGGEGRSEEGSLEQ